MIITKAFIILIVLVTGLATQSYMSSSSEEEDFNEPGSMTRFNQRIVRQTNNNENGAAAQRSNAIWKLQKDGQEAQQLMMTMENEMDYDSNSSAALESSENLEDFGETKRQTRQAKADQTKALEERVTYLAAFHEDIHAIADNLKADGDYLQGTRSQRVKRQDVGNLLNIGDLTSKTLPINGILNGGNGGGGLLESILGDRGLVSNLLTSLLGGNLQHGLLGGLLNTVGGKVLGEKIFHNLLGAITHLLHEVLNILRRLLGQSTLPSYHPSHPSMGSGHGSLLSLNINALISVLNQFHDFAGTMPHYVNGTDHGAQPQICFDVDESGHIINTQSLIQIDIEIIVKLESIRKIIQSDGNSFARNGRRRICCTPDSHGNITELVIDDTKIQKNNKGLFSIINLSTHVGLSLDGISGLLNLLNQGSITNPSGSSSQDYCFDVDSAGTLWPRQSTGVISARLTVFLNVLSQILAQINVNIGTGHWMCVRPTTDGDITHIVVDGTSLIQNPSRPFSLFNFNLNIDYNSKIMINILNLLVTNNAVGSHGGGFGSFNTTKRVCFNIPITQSGGGLINISANININSNAGGGHQQATRRICIMVHIPQTGTTTTTTTTTKKPGGDTTTKPTTTTKPGGGTTPTGPPPPHKRCYKKTCKRWRSTECYKCHSKRNARPEYKIVMTQ